MFQTPLLMKKLNVTYPGQMVIKNTSQEIQGDWQHAGGKDVGCGSQIFFFICLTPTTYAKFIKIYYLEKQISKHFIQSSFFCYHIEKQIFFFSEGFIIAL